MAEPNWQQMNFFGNIEDFRQWLDRLGLFKVKLGLGRMDRALAKCCPGELPFPVVQVLGTNGKGSTSTFLDSLARAHGIRTGLYTSPHFVSPGERILVNGAQLSEGDWLDCANRIMGALPGGGDLSYFEFLTVLAIMLFKKHDAQLAIIEAGLGGKNDATTALPAFLHVFTPIDMDHAAIIGPDLADIARDKAAAIKPQSQVLSAPQCRLAAKIIWERAKACGAKINFAPELSPNCATGLAGAHQRVNAGLACVAFEHIAGKLGLEPDAAAIARGLQAAFIPGRLQKIRNDPPVLLDGGHNPHALGKVLPEAGKILGENISLVFSALADKDWRQMVEILTENFPQAQFFVPTLDNPRALPADVICGQINSRLPGQARMVKDSGAAFRLALDRGRPALVIGSLYLLSEIYAQYPQYLLKTGVANNEK